MKKPLLSELTLREKIGQTALVHSNQPGFKDLGKYPFGCMWACGDLNFGIKLEEVNPDLNKRDKWLQSIEAVNAKLKVPIIRAGDCSMSLPPKEYGYVFDAMTVGATGDEELAYERGALIGRMLRHYSINWLWSPIYDFYTGNIAGGGIGRTFSDDPELLFKMNMATVRGLNDQGVGATAKHFPGCDGMEYRDAHFSETRNLLTLDEWKAKQGKIFQKAIDAGIESIMTGHTCLPAVDNTMHNGRYVPASLSHKIVTKLLKEEMGFKGVVITDDVWMRSVLTYCDDDRAKVYIEAVKAGCDIVLGVLQDYIDIIEDAVNRGEIPVERIDDACQRVLDLKEKIGLFNEDYELCPGDLDKLNADMQDFCNRAAKKAVSLVCDKKKILPLNKEKTKKVCIIYSGHDTESDSSSSAYAHMQIMVKEFEKRGAQVRFQHGLLNSYASEAELKEISENYDLIVYAGFLDRWQPHGISSFYGKEISTFQNALRYGGEKSIGIGLRSPFVYFNFYFAFPAFINTYNHQPELIKAAVAAMYGEIGFEGGEPFKLVPKHVSQRLELFGKTEI
ncbi:MAG: glycoside hydrolase family 3 protein [Clostridia bacterium]|nr:glycoside hydrolase family 3 protein [Clostridia bacterium]